MKYLLIICICTIRTKDILLIDMIIKPIRLSAIWFQIWQGDEPSVLGVNSIVVGGFWFLV